MQKKLIALSLLSMASTGFAANNNCAPTPAATCYAGDCKSCYCLGPENTMVNAPVCPRTCSGDFIINVAGFYWNAHQDGMEYAVSTHMTNPLDVDTVELTSIIDGEYYTPDFKWDWGFKLGLGYCTTCDGWDIGATWTWYHGKAHDSVELERDCNRTLLPIWSAYAAPFNDVFDQTLWANRIDTDWSLKLNLIDIEMGRNFWTSKYLAIRPFVGLRIAYIYQDYTIENKGGAWRENTGSNPSGLSEVEENNEVDLRNDYKGVGLRAGLDSTWNLGCGWAIYGDLAASILYGRFTVDHDESNREAMANHEKNKLLNTHYSFRASRAVLDLGLGLQWSSMFCDCQYGLTLALGWEHHLFFHQNQLWRVVRIKDNGDPLTPNGRSSQTGENVHHQRRGNLDTQGWTLSLKFEF